MVRTGRAITDSGTIAELMEKQNRRCAGCGNILHFIYSRDWSKKGVDTLFELWKEEEEELTRDAMALTTGWVNLEIPRRLGGTNSVTNLRLLCTPCLGSEVKHIRLPNWLINKSERFMDKNDFETGNIAHLMRTALEHYISSDDEHKEKAKIADAVKEFEMKISKWMESMPEELARYSSPTADYERDGILFEVKSKRIDDKQQGEDSGPSDVV